MLKQVILLFLVVGFVSLNSCKEAEKEETEIVETEMPDLEAIKADVFDFETKWAAAVNAKNIDAIMAMYTEDAVSMPEGSEMLVGKEAIKAKLSADMDSETGTIGFETLDVYAQGDFVTETGKTIIKDAAGKVTYQGKYITVLQKSGDSLLCAREMWNNDSPTK